MNNDVIKAKIDFYNGVVSDDKSQALLENLVKANDINIEQRRQIADELSFIDAIYAQPLVTEMPSSNLDDRFYKMLEQASAMEKSSIVSAGKADKPPTLFSAIKSFFEKLAPAPVWQAAALVTVFAFGYQSNGYQSNDMSLEPAQIETQLASSSQIEALNQQVSSLNALVAMSMISSDSAAKRLAGIEYSQKVSRVDSDLNQALLQLLRSDSSTSIRLFALDAIAKQGRELGLSPVSEQALLDSLDGQRTMVQVNIIAVLSELGSDNSFKALQALAAGDILQQDAKSFLTQVQNQAI